MRKIYSGFQFPIFHSLSNDSHFLDKCRQKIQKGKTLQRDLFQAEAPERILMNLSQQFTDKKLLEICLF